MKNLLLVLVLVFALPAVAKKRSWSKVAEVNFKSKSHAHNYQLIKKKSNYYLYFKAGAKKAKRIKLNAQQVAGINNNITKIIWENKYRKPSSANDSCYSYVTLSNQQTKTQVCYQNRKLVGYSYRLLKKLHRLYE